MKLKLLIAALVFSFNTSSFAQVLIGDVTDPSKYSLEQLKEIERNFLVRLTAIAKRATIANAEKEPVLYQSDVKLTSYNIIQLNPIQNQIVALGGKAERIPSLPPASNVEPSAEPAANDYHAWAQRWLRRYETSVKRASVAIEVLDRSLYDFDQRVAGGAYDKILELNKAIVAEGGTPYAVPFFPGFYAKESK